MGLDILYSVWWSLQSYGQGGVQSVPFVKMPALSFHQCEQGLPAATELWSKMLCVMADMQPIALLHRFGLIYCDDIIIKCCLSAVIQLWFRKAQKPPNSTNIVFSGLFFLNSCWSLRMGLYIIIVRLLSIGLSTIDLGSWWLYWISSEQPTGQKEQTTVFFLVGGGVILRRTRLDCGAHPPFGKTVTINMNMTKII